MALWPNGWPSWPNEGWDPTTSPPPLGAPFNLERATLYKSRLTRCGPKPPRSIVGSFCTPNSIKSEPPGNKREAKRAKEWTHTKRGRNAIIVQDKFSKKETRRLKVLTSLASPSTCVSIANDKTGKTCKPLSFNYYNGQLLGKETTHKLILFYVCDH